MLNRLRLQKMVCSDNVETHPVTPDGHYFVVRRPVLALRGPRPEAGRRKALVQDLMTSATGGALRQEGRARGRAGGP